MDRDDLNQIADDIIDNLPLEEQVRIANLKDWGIEALQEGLLRYILPDMNDDPEGLSKVMEMLCARLRDMHRLRAVK